MTVGIRTLLSNITIAGVTYNGAVDLDNVFELRGTAAPAADVGARSDTAADLSSRYYPRSLGGATLPVDVGYRNSASIDYRHIFAQKGTLGGDSGGGGGCLPYGTIIPLANGTTKRIEDIVPGDVVLGYYVDGMIDESVSGWTEWSVEREDGKRGQIVTVTVRMTMHSTYPSHWLINGKLQATYEHTFFVARGDEWRWRQARELLPSDSFLSMDREEVPIESAEFVEAPLQVANIDVEDVDCFFFLAFDGTYVLSHNPNQKN